MKKTINGKLQINNKFFRFSYTDFKLKIFLSDNIGSVCEEFNVTGTVNIEPIHLLFDRLQGSDEVNVHIYM